MSSRLSFAPPIDVEIPIVPSEAGHEHRSEHRFQGWFPISAIDLDLQAVDIPGQLERFADGRAHPAAEEFVFLAEEGAVEFARVVSQSKEPELGVVLIGRVHPRLNRAPGTSRRKRKLGIELGDPTRRVACVGFDFEVTEE